MSLPTETLCRIVVYRHASGNYVACVEGDPDFSATGTSAASALRVLAPLVAESMEPQPAAAPNGFDSVYRAVSYGKTYLRSRPH